MPAAKKRSPAATRKGASAPKQTRVQKRAPTAKRAKRTPASKRTADSKGDDAGKMITKVAFPPSQHVFPVSNARECKETETPFIYQPLEHRTIEFKACKVCPDHLTELPKPGFKYLSVKGRRLFNRRYDEVVKIPKETMQSKDDDLPKLEELIDDMKEALAQYPGVAPSA